MSLIKIVKLADGQRGVEYKTPPVGGMEIIHSDGKRVVAAISFYNALLLADQRKPFVSPMRHGYGYPAYKPYPHQYAATNMASVFKRCFFLMEMRTGKSPSAVWVADYLLNHVKDSGVKRVLIVGTLSTLYDTWVKEIYRIVPNPSVTVLHADLHERRKMVKDGAAFHITNYRGAALLAKELKANKYDLVILDELRAFKETSTQLWKAMRDIIHPTARVIGLTGSPCPKDLVDAYGQIKLVRPENLKGLTKSSFRDMLYNQSYTIDVRRKGANGVERIVKIPKYVKREGADEILKDYFYPAIRVALADVLPNLPPVTFEYRWCDLTPSQRKAFKALLAEDMAEVGGKEISAASAAHKVGLLFQICGGAIKATDGTQLEFAKTGRMSVIKEILEESNGRALIMSDILAVGDAIHAQLPKSGRITGATSLQDRQAMFDGLKVGTYDTLVCTPKTIAHGVDAQSVDTIIWAYPPMSSEIFVQANKRIAGPNQRSQMRIVMLYSEKIEQSRFEDVQGMLQDQESFLSLYKSVFKGVVVSDQKAKTVAEQWDDWKMSGEKPTVKVVAKFRQLADAGRKNLRGELKDLDTVLVQADELMLKALKAYQNKGLGEAIEVDGIRYAVNKKERYGAEEHLEVRWFIIEGILDELRSAGILPSIQKLSNDDIQDAIYETATQIGAWKIYNKALNETFISEYKAEYNELPPGIYTFEDEKVSATMAKSAKKK